MNLTCLRIHINNLEFPFSAPGLESTDHGTQSICLGRCWHVIANGYEPMLFIVTEDDLLQFELVPDIAEQLSAVLHGYLHGVFNI